MWERFSYYGMRGFLILYMVKALGFTDVHAGSVYGNYVGSVWQAAIFGGVIGDRWLGHYRSVLIGGAIIALGHFTLAFHALSFFYTGLTLIVVGTGLLKPNVSTLVGSLYKQGDERRDAGFSIFYMGINLGAFLSPIVVGFLAQAQWFRHFISSIGFDPNSAWHWGFGAAGVGMTLGLIQYVVGGSRLKSVGGTPENQADIASARLSGSFDYLTVGLAILGSAIGTALGYYFGDAGFVSALFPGVVGFFSGYLAGTTRFLMGDELKRVIVIFILFVFSILFWMTYEQAGSSLTLFADRMTKTTVFGWQYPSSWFQSVPAIFVIIFAPMFAWLWQRMGN